MFRTNQFNNHLLSFIWLMLFILPNNIVFYLFVPISFVFLYRIKAKVPANIQLVNIALLISITITLLINIEREFIVQNDIFRALEVIILIITFAKLRGIIILKPYIVSAVAYLIITQFAYLLNISTAINYIQTFYRYEGTKDIYGYYEQFKLDDVGIKRLGGIYHNSNQYARYIQIVLITLLCEIKQFRKVERWIIIPLIIVSISATGSRTSFIILVAITFMHLYSNKLLSLKNIIILGGVGFVFIIYLISSTDILEYRMIKINEGMDNSFFIKIEMLNEYYKSNPSFINLLFGNLSGIIKSGSSRLNGTDFDIGNIPILFGYVFFLIFIVFSIIAYRRILPPYRVIFPILIWMFSSSIICNYRTAPIIFLILGLYYRRSLIEK